MCVFLHQFTLILTEGQPLQDDVRRRHGDELSLLLLRAGMFYCYVYVVCDVCVLFVVAAGMFYCYGMCCMCCVFYCSCCCRYVLWLVVVYVVCVVCYIVRVSALLLIDGVTLAF